MKKTIMTLAALVLTLTAFAGPIGKQQAMNTAKAFMKKVNANAVLQTTTVRHAPRLNGASDAQPYYVFNAENNQGFVIVSGDDRSEEILGYSDTGHFEGDNLPEALEGMLTDFVNDLKELDEAGLTEPLTSASLKGPRKAVSIARKSVAPLTTSTWTQGVPFANHTPTYINDKGQTAHAPVGCVSTAVAQVLYFHKYAKIPETGIPGYTQASGEFKGEVFDALPYREFDFSQMKDSYSSYTSAQGTLIGDFMEYINRALKASFGKDGTYVKPESVPALFRKYFGYLSTAVHRQTCGATEFENYIYNDLAQGLPVWTAGHSMPGRHSFVIDGYSYDDFFHINWGWSGSCNGYFRLAPLNAYNTSTGHAYAKHYYAMIGARPNDDRYPNYKSYAPSATASADLKDMYFTTTEGTMVTSDRNSSTGFTSSLTTVLENYTNSLGSSNSRDFDVLMTLYDANMQALGSFKADVETVKITQAKTAVVNFTLGSKLHNLNLADGEYKLVPRSRETGQANYFFDRAKGAYAYVKVIKSGSSIRLTLVPTYTIDNHEIIGQLKNGYRAALRIHVTNNSFSKIANTLVLYKKSITDANTQDVQQMRIEPQSQGYVDLGFDVGSSTSNQTLLLLDKEGVAYSSSINAGLQILSTTFKANTGTEATRNLSFNWVAENANSSQTTFYGSEFKGYVEIVNNGSEPYNDLFTLQTYIGSTTYSSYPYYKYVSSVHALSIPAGGSAKIDLGVFSYSDIYNAYKTGITQQSVSYDLYDGSRQFQDDDNLKPISSKVWNHSSSAYFWWDKNGKMTAATSMSSIPEAAVAVSFMDKSAGSTLKPNSNPNTIYYFTSTPSSSSSFYSHNFVVGSRTGTKTASRAIKFNDNYGAYVPYGFTAKAGVSYTRTFDYGYEKDGDKGWTTICLPFTVTSVKKGSAAIDWYHSSQDRGKLFWVNQFYGEDFTKSIYTYTEQIAANTPYLIAMPGDSWGDQWSLVNKTITFSAGNGAKVAGGYNVVDGLASVDADNQNFMSAAMAYRDIQKGKSVFSMENPGNAFQYVPNPDLNSFRGYITKETATSLVSMQGISIISITDNDFEGGETDGIRQIENGRMAIENGVVYDLQGRVVSSTGLKALPKGMYIMNGKKFVIK